MIKNFQREKKKNCPKVHTYEQNYAGVMNMDIFCTNLRLCKSGISVAKRSIHNLVSSSRCVHLCETNISENEALTNACSTMTNACCLS